MYTKNNMNCPECGTSIDVDQLLVDQFENSIRKELQSELKERIDEFEEEKSQIATISRELERKHASVDELVHKRVKDQIKLEQERLRKSIESEVESEKQEQLLELEAELNRKSNQLREMNKTKAQLASLRREMEEKEAEIHLQKERELTEKLEAAKLSIKEQLHQESFLKLKEREKVIDELKVKLDEAKRKAEQGSMQIQGDVQEEELEDILKRLYPEDDVDRISKGVNGADIIQTLRMKNGAEFGKIYIESKATKSFVKGWIAKLKKDNLQIGADVLVIVSRTLPSDIRNYDIRDGVWICGVNHIKELSLALRYGLLKVNEVKVVQNGKETKMEVLYNYLTSSEFKGVFEAIIDGFKVIQETHFDEKVKIQRLWKKREHQLDSVLRNSVDFYGSLKGIAGESISDIKFLEMPKAS